jgi:hypothetical protein
VYQRQVLRWTVADVDRATATGQVPICWCGTPVTRDRDGGWTHVAGGYSCRVAGVWLPGTAQPRPATPRRVLPLTGRQAI